MKKIMVVIGTRPEAIKMAPLVHALREEKHFDPVICLTGQHREMLDQVLEILDIKPDIDLNIMTKGQHLSMLTASLLQRLDTVFQLHEPDCVLVHGDTTTAMTAGLAAFYRQIPVGHVEAGLRTYNLYDPWPEEMNRHFIDLISTYYFAPTERSRYNLLKESVPSGRIHVTGNTVVDALMMACKRIDADRDLGQRLAASFPFLDSAKKMILVTGHRRESHGDKQAEKCRALKLMAERTDVQVVFSVHPNPKVQEVVSVELGDVPNVHLIPPQDYLHFIYLMKQSYFILTDSGGIQEEAPSLGKPVLVTRETTERPEALEAGTIKLVGSSMGKIVAECERLLTDSAYYERFGNCANPYGDGQACRRIVDALLYY